MMRTLVMIGLAAACLLADNAPKQRIETTNTQRLDFAGGAVLRLENSTGELMIQGWDRPDVEITTIKSSPEASDSKEREKSQHELDQVTVKAERMGDEIVVTTAFVRHGKYPPPLPAGARFDLEYYIKAPRNVKLVVGHDAGEVHIDDFTNDISVITRRGEITLRLPGDGQYAIDARTKAGNVSSDFPGRGKWRAWLTGREFDNAGSGAAHKLFLRNGFGDIIIWKTIRL